MKKFLVSALTIALSATLLFSTTACGKKNNLHLISLSDEVMENFIAGHKIDGKYDVYSKVKITHEQYDFIPADAPVDTIGVSATYIVTNDMPVEQAYNITKAIWESKGSIGNKVESMMDLNKAFVTIGNCKIHPGAAKYYREKGLTVADEQIATVTNTENIGNVILTTGGTSGTYYAFTNGLQVQLGKKVSDTSFTVQSSGGSVDNINKINRGDAHVGIVQNDTMVNAYNGLTSNFASGAVTSFSVIGEVYSEVVQIVSNDANINSLADLKKSKKVVSIGDIGSGVELNAIELFKAYGFEFKENEKTVGDKKITSYSSLDFTITNLSAGNSADAMKDGACDVFFFTSGAPTTAITELAVALA